MMRNGTVDAKTTEVVSLHDVWVDYDGVSALEGVSLTVHEHDFLGVIGPNGGGKSTLLKAMLGLVTPRMGTVLLAGQPPSKASTAVGYVPQYTNFDRRFPITVWDVVLTGRLSKSHLLKPYGAEDRAAATQALQTVGMSELHRRAIGELSGGQQQRALIARALVSNPSLLLLDEAMANVDPTVQEELYSLLHELSRTITIIMVSHNLSAISTYVDKVACLNQRLYYHGTKEIPPEDVEAAYGCPVELLAHGMPHRVLRRHE